MSDFSDYMENAIVNVFRGTALPAITPYVALFSIMPNEAGTGGTEVTTTIRTAGRVTATLGAPSNGVALSTADIDFGSAAGAADIVGFGFYDAASAGNLVTLKAFKTSTVSISIASPGVIGWTAHGLINGNAVRFTTTGSLPTGLSANTTYYVVNAATDTFSVAATPGGSAINTSGTQSGTHTASQTFVATQGTRVYFPSGSINLTVQ